jgi:hypothetical protein
MRLLMYGILALVLGASVTALSIRQPTEAASATTMMLSHDVYFSLKDNSADARKKLVAACKKYLAKHPGTVFFAAGTVASEFDRPVNDRDYDVALHLVFKDKESHDKYQEAPLHKQFIDENKDNWKKVRVFDSWVDQ